MVLVESEIKHKIFYIERKLYIEYCNVLRIVTGFSN